MGPYHRFSGAKLSALFLAPYLRDFVLLRWPTSTYISWLAMSDCVMAHWYPRLSVTILPDLLLLVVILFDLLNLGLQFCTPVLACGLRVFLM